MSASTASTRFSSSSRRPVTESSDCNRLGQRELHELGFALDQMHLARALACLELGPLPHVAEESNQPDSTCTLRPCVLLLHNYTIAA